ncbi:MAG TPA: oligosaccharide flippase family protein [Bacillota bacterium]
MKARPNLKNFFYLVSSGLAIQLIGTLYRVWLARRIGAAGLGIFSMIYPLYRLLSSVATIGLPPALTKWVAEYLVSGEYRAIGALRNWSIQVVLYTSVITAALLHLCVPFLSRFLFSDPRVTAALPIVAWAIPFSAVSAIVRGYYQGFSLMGPNALSEVTEQLAEVGTTIIGLHYLVSRLPLASYTYPIIGLTCGEFVCLATLFFIRQPQPELIPSTAVAVAIPRIEILQYSWPLLVNQIVGAVSSASEGVLIPRLLIRAGYSVAQSTHSLGLLNGMAAPVAYFPLLLLFPLGSVISPQISSCFKSGALPTLRTKIRCFYLVTAVISLSCFGLILLSSDWISRLLYQSLQPVILIKVLSAGMPFSALTMLNFSIMAATGATNNILTISLWAIGLKTTLLFLTGHLGIHGVAWAIVIIQIFTALTSMLELRPFFTKLDA